MINCKDPSLSSHSTFSSLNSPVPYAGAALGVTPSHNWGYPLSLADTSADWSNEVLLREKKTGWSSPPLLATPNTTRIKIDRLSVYRLNEMDNEAEGVRHARSVPPNLRTTGGGGGTVIIQLIVLPAIGGANLLRKKPEAPTSRETAPVGGGGGYRYYLAKTSAENLAWKMSEEAGCSFKLAVMNPCTLIHCRHRRQAACHYYTSRLKVTQIHCRCAGCAGCGGPHIAAMAKETGWGQRFVLMGERANTSTRCRVVPVLSSSSRFQANRSHHL